MFIGIVIVYIDDQKTKKLTGQTSLDPLIQFARNDDVNVVWRFNKLSC